MNVVVLPRGKGKTTMMVSASALSGVPILCANRMREKHICEVAKELGLKIPTPVVIGTQRGKRIQEVLVDDAEDILRLLIKEELGAEVLGMTITGNDEKPPATPTTCLHSRDATCPHTRKLGCSGNCADCSFLDSGKKKGEKL